MDSYEKYLEEKKNNQKTAFKIFNRATPTHIVLFAVLFFVGTLIAKSNSNKWVYFVVGGLGVLYFFSVMKQAPEKTAIPRHVAVKIAHEDLLREIGENKSYIEGTSIFPNGAFKDQSWDDGTGPKLFKYNIGFKIKEPNYAEKEFIYQMNPFTGEGKGVVEAPVGFWGQDVKDIQMIFPEKVIKEESPK